MSTSSSFVIDTYAWVEYLVGSKAGSKAKGYIESGKALTPSISVDRTSQMVLTRNRNQSAN